MFRIRVQARLVSFVTLEEDLLDVGSVLRRAALVQVSKGDADGRSNGIPFCRLGVGRVGGEAGIDTLALCEVASDVLAAEAVTHRSDLGDVVSGADRVERGVDHGFNVGERMALLPVWKTVV